MASGRITGLCGRLRCCRAFEHPQYKSFRDRAPRIGTRVVTPEGLGKVTSYAVPKDACVVELERPTVGRSPERVEISIDDWSEATEEDVEQARLAALETARPSEREDRRSSSGGRRRGREQKQTKKGPGESGERRRKSARRKKRSGSGGSGKADIPGGGAAQGQQGGQPDGAKPKKRRRRSRRRRRDGGSGSGGSGGGSSTGPSGPGPTPGSDPTSS